MRMLVGSLGRPICILCTESFAGIRITTRETDRLAIPPGQSTTKGMSQTRPCWALQRLLYTLEDLAHTSRRSNRNPRPNPIDHRAHGVLDSRIWKELYDWLRNFDLFSLRCSRVLRQRPRLQVACIVIQASLHLRPWSMVLLLQHFLPRTCRSVMQPRTPPVSHIRQRHCDTTLTIFDRLTGSIQNILPSPVRDRWASPVGPQ